MKRGVLVVVGGAAIVVAGLAGCSSNKSTSSSSSSASASASSSSATVSASASASAGTGSTKITIDGVDQNMNGGTVVCSATGGNFNIAIGEGTSGVSVVMSEDASTVHSVALGNINGVALGFQEGAAGGANATATKDGNNYKVTGTATGVDMNNPMQPVNKPFEIDVVCP